MVYALVEEGRSVLVPRLVETARAIDGVDLVMWRASDGTAAIARGAGNDGGEAPDGELRFAPGAGPVDARGSSWIVDGDLEVLGIEVDGGRIRCDAYPDALARVWAALSCATSGDVLLSAASGREFPDWGGADHVGAGSHGSLHADDSLGALVYCGVDPPSERDGTAAGWSGWSIADITPMILQHFGVRA
jgi:hypothetical protein